MGRGPVDRRVRGRRRHGLRLGPGRGRSRRPDRQPGAAAPGRRRGEARCGQGHRGCAALRRPRREDPPRLRGPPPRGRPRHRDRPPGPRRRQLRAAQGRHAAGRPARRHRRDLRARARAPRPRRPLAGRPHLRRPGPRPRRRAVRPGRSHAHRRAVARLRLSHRAEDRGAGRVPARPSTASSGRGAGGTRRSASAAIRTGPRRSASRAAASTWPARCWCPPARGRTPRW